MKILKIRVFPIQVLRTIYIILAILASLTGCVNGQQLNTLPLGTTSGTQSTTSATTSTKSTSPSTNPNNSTVKPTKQPRTSTSISPDEKATITEMLEVIPDTLAPLSYIYYVDFASWRTKNSISDLDIYKDYNGYPLEGGENRYITDIFLFQEGENYFIPYGTAPFISGMYPHSERMLQSPIRTNNIGYGPLDIDQSIYAVSYLTNSDIIRYEAIKGYFDLTAISQATSNTYFDLDNLPQISEYDGLDIYSWNGEMNIQRILKPPIFDNLGQGRSLAVQQHEILGAIEAVNLYEMIGAKNGSVNSIATNPRFKAIVECLEKAGAASAMMSEMTLSYIKYKITLKNLNMPLNQKTIQLFEKADLEASLMGPYSAFASGLGIDERGLFVILILTYDSVEKAENDIEVLKTRIATSRNNLNILWKEEIDASEVWVEGTSLCAKLRGNITDYWEGFLYDEPLLVREN
jgi:hypothetical protein